MSGKLLLPGLIDPHVHLRDLGQIYKEDFYTGTAAALAGGFTTILDMPNNKIPITTIKTLREKITIARKKIICDVGFHFGSLGDNLGEFKKVQSMVYGLKLYLNKTTGNFIIKKSKLKEIFESWKSAQSIALHSNILSAKPILLHSEYETVGYVLELVRKTGARVHFCHISTASDLKQIIKAKQENLPVTCGVTPHHLFLTENDVKRLGPFAMLKPPLGSKRDQDFLWKNLKFIDTVESDHAPHTIEEKRGETPPFGVPGLETTLPLLLTAVSQKRLIIKEILRLCYINPAKIFNIKTDPKTKIEVDPNCKFQISNFKLFTKCGWSPFEGWEMKGKVKSVFIRGKKVFENGKILAKPSSGKILKVVYN